MTIDPSMPFPAPIGRPAATLILARDSAEGPEIFLMQRHHAASFVAGAHVFPGGALDPADEDPWWASHGLDDGQASRILGLSHGGLAYWVAAVRECFEESGLLLVRDADGRAPDPSDLAALRERVADTAPGNAAFLALCRERRLSPLLADMAYLSHWITPPGRPRCFDTRFFIARAPQGQLAQADQSETVAHAWMRPAEALEKKRLGEIDLVFATTSTLQALAAFDSVDAMLAHARSPRAIPALRAWPSQAGGRERLLLPGDRGYAEVVKLDPEGVGMALSEILPGRPVRLSPRIVRVTAPNPGVMTGPGTNSYLVGTGELALIDPGPALPEHVDALAAAIAQSGGTLRWILTTHTHPDHSPAAQALKALTGATVLGMPAPPLERQDHDFAPDRVPVAGERIVAGDATLRVLHTPGHASNHLCYLLEDERLLFTGDHVMGGSTVVINPPDGNMREYFASLEALLEEDLEWLAPGHGFLIGDPHGAVRRLLAHRRAREDKVLRALRAVGSARLEALVPAVYDDVPANRHAPAARSLLAHLVKLEAEGKAVANDGVWRAA
ncbi:MBL fold metallo-hydrolase [Noviherbaspirillum pedocola]|uniref:MBL fold metallo-hydrolase n=1 Tax=Noviherbaspirillum pedocola TaxID=2801341 RepID=A0A934SY69_9BURK|nr:MBL fold metallo-hydrolase [Noviherbaspirillum pedocola]MBK4737733.1 MBL fold metallo-hydrolase [Noviherbaspirillum pedocola]